MDYNRQPMTTAFSDAAERNKEYCPKCGKKNDKVQFPSCGIPVTCTTDGTVVSGPENCPLGFHDIKPIKAPIEWINVKDQLPETRKDVLTVIQESGYNYREMQVGCYTCGGEIEFDDIDEDFPECYDEDYDCSYLPEGWWFLESDGEKSVKRNVTHWMELPTLPVKE